MTEVPVEQLDGMALSAAVAQEVMGWQLDGNNWSRFFDVMEYTFLARQWRPHDNTDQALRLVSAIRDKHRDWWCWIEECYRPAERIWRCGWRTVSGYLPYASRGATLPLAICRAALVAVRECGQGMEVGL